MGRKSPEVIEFQKAHGITESEMWEVRPGAWAVKHSAIERLVAQQGIKFERPAIIEVNTAEKIMVICVFGTLGDRTEWSFGEASPANCKIAYPAAIAEKRAKDRVAIKLINATGEAIYSEEEFAEDTQPRQNPHVTRADDIYESLSDDIQPPAEMPAKMRVKDARGASGKGEYQVLLDEMKRHQDKQELFEWAADEDTKKRIYALPGQWPQFFRGEYDKHMNSLKGKAA